MTTAPSTTIYDHFQYRCIGNLYFSPAIATIKIQRGTRPDTTSNILSKDLFAQIYSIKNVQVCKQSANCQSLLSLGSDTTIVSEYDTDSMPSELECPNFTPRQPKVNPNKRVFGKILSYFTKTSDISKSEVGSPVDRMDHESYIKTCSEILNENNIKSNLQACGNENNDGEQRAQEKLDFPPKTSSIYKNTTDQVNYHLESGDKSYLGCKYVFSDSNQDSWICDSTSVRGYFLKRAIISELTNIETSDEQIVTSTDQDKESPTLEISELNLRLKGSLKSSFLSDEFKLLKTFKTDAESIKSSEAIRKIDEILLHYGILNHTNNERDGGEISKSFGECFSETTNLSHNNEAKFLSETRQAEIKDAFYLNTAADVHRLTTMQTANVVNTISTKEQNAQYNDLVISHSSSNNFRKNVSQNNETSTLGSNAQEDVLRKYGSSVDFKSADDESLPHGRYDYGKSVPFSGDKSTDAQLIQPTVPSSNDGNAAATLVRRSEGSHVDVMKPPQQNTTIDAVKDDENNFLKNFNAPKDSLEATLLNEKERLRRLDSLITASSLSSSMVSTFNVHTSRFHSPYQEVYNYRTTIPTDKAQSSPTLPLLNYGTTSANKTSWQPSGRSNIQAVRLGKSDTSSGKWSHNYISSNKHEKPTNPRARSSHHSTTNTANRQGNNSAYFFPYVDKIANDKTSSKNHQNILSNKIKECCLKNKCKKYNLNSNKQINHLPSVDVNRYSSHVSVYSSCRNGTGCNMLSGYNASIAENKYEKGNINDSKSTSNPYQTYYPFINLDRKLQNNMLPSTNVPPKSSQAVQKKSTYKPCTLLEAKKNETFFEHAKELFTRNAPNGSSSNSAGRKPSFSTATTGRILDHASSAESTALKGTRGQSSSKRR